MDDAMIARLLSTYDGAQPTVKNVNAARQFFATNPEIAEKRAMGLRGSGIDDNSDIFGAQLEKFMQAAEAEPPAGRVEVGPIEQVAAPTSRQAAPRQAPAQMSNMPAQPGQNRQAEYGPTGPITREAARGGKGFGIDDVITALLGLSSTAGRKMMSGVNPNDPRLPPQLQGPEKLAQLQGPEELKRLTYQPKLEDANKNRQAFLKEAETTRSMSDIDILRQKYGLSSEEADQLLKQNTPSTVRSDPALEAQGKRAQLQAEIDAENANQKLEMEAEQRIKAQEAKRLQDQIATKKLLDASRKSRIGR